MPPIFRATSKLASISILSGICGIVIGLIAASALDLHYIKKHDADAPESTPGRASKCPANQPPKTHLDCLLLLDLDEDPKNTTDVALLHSVLPNRRQQT